MADRITQKIGFTRARDMYEQLGDAEMVEFFNARLAQLNKSASTERKKTPRQIENDAYKQIITTGMVTGKDYTINDILTYMGLPVDFSYQRASALLSQLIDEHIVNKTYDNKRVAHFTLVA